MICDLQAWAVGMQLAYVPRVGFAGEHSLVHLKFTSLVHLYDDDDECYYYYYYYYYYHYHFYYHCIFLLLQMRC